MLKEVEVEDYRVFKRKSTLQFQKGLTYIAGKNNTGKTTALSILSNIRDSALIPNRNQYSLNSLSGDPVL